MPVDEDLCGALIKNQTYAVAVHENQRGEVRLQDVHNSLSQAGGKPGQGFAAAMVGMQVRRLSVTECERLQGFPDGWTQIPYRGKPAADGPRYKALGNSMACNAMQWLGERIALVDALHKEQSRNSATEKALTAQAACVK